MIDMLFVFTYFIKLLDEVVSVFLKYEIPWLHISLPTKIVETLDKVFLLTFYCWIRGVYL